MTNLHTLQKLSTIIISMIILPVTLGYIISLYMFGEGGASPILGFQISLVIVQISRMLRYDFL